MRRILVFQAGTGRVGKALIRKIIEFNREQTAVQLVHIGLANSRCSLFNRSGLSIQLLWEISRGADPCRFQQNIESGAFQNEAEFLSEWHHGLAGEQLVFLDLTDSATITPALLKMAGAGIRLVLANKKPLVGDYDTFRKLAEQDSGLRATVGAGLPVIPAIKELIKKDIRIIVAEGCFSGTLGNLCTALEQGRSFSTFLQQAVVNGLTEPDPRDDLSGEDLARKILIISRLAGYPASFKDIETKPLFPGEWKTLPLATFMERLQELDTDFSTMFSQAAKSRVHLRVAAMMELGICRVGMKSFPPESPLGSLKGSGKAVVLRGQGLAEQVVVVGEGAGPESAARDVLLDILGE